MQAERHRILIFDEDNTKRDDLMALLREIGYSPVAVSDSDKAVEMVAAHDYDLALLGIRMPWLGGYQVLERIEAMPALGHIPVIVVAAGDALEYVAKCLEAGAEDFLLEPYDTNLVNFRIRACLETRRRRQQEIHQGEPQERTRLIEGMTRFILPLGASLSAERDPNRLVERILLETKEFCNADAGTLYMSTDDNKALRFSIMLTDSLGIALGGTTGKEIPFPPLPLYDARTGALNEHNVAAHVALHGHSINIPDIYTASGFDFSEAKAFDAMNNYRSKSCLAIPLKDHTGEVIGVLQLINAMSPETGEVESFNTYSQQVVELLAFQAAIALSNQRLLQEREKLMKFERDIQIGRQIQTDFLPEKLPQPEGWEIAARFHPAREVAGDFYDVFPLPDRRHVGLVIADVCDKGVAAALFMALIRSLIRAFSEQSANHGLLSNFSGHISAHSSQTTGMRLRNMFTNMSAINTIILTNSYLISNHSDANMFATLFLGILDPLTGSLTYVNCGHNPPAIFSEGEMKSRLEPTGPAIGVIPDMEFDIAEAVLEPGNILYTFTDGATDAHDPMGKMFTEPRLLSLVEMALQEQPDLSADDLLGRIDESLNAHIGAGDQFDDITMLALRRASQP